MFAIVHIAGFQYKVEPGRYIYVNRLPQDEGANVDFNEVLLVSDESKAQVGAPFISGAKVTGTVLMHLKGDKVIVFKKKKRKGYKVKRGHRQYLTKLQIDNILA